MDATPGRFAYRCLPLTMANQLGWDLQCPCAVEATWDGGPTIAAIKVRAEGVWGGVRSHFGHGVLTFSPGYHFSISPGHFLWVRGPSNQVKDGIAPLDGLVEAWWLPFTFTMNWKFTRPGTIHFLKGEPYCTLTPYPQGYAESFEPAVQAMSEEEAETFTAWSTSRERFSTGLKHREPKFVEEGWQKTYMKGLSLPVGGEKVPSHQSRLKLQEFKVVGVPMADVDSHPTHSPHGVRCGRCGEDKFIAVGKELSCVRCGQHLPPIPNLGLESVEGEDWMEA